MAAPNLTTLARVKAWLGITNSSDDTLLNSLITAASRYVYQYISLPSVAVQNYSERRDGYGNRWIRPFAWPLISVTSIKYAGFNITREATGNPPTQGYTINKPFYGPGRVTVHGYPCFPHGKDQLLIDYRAGFLQEEVREVPATPHQITPRLLWAGNIEVLDALGATMAQVSGAPGPGEYAVDDLGVYTFNVAQEGAQVTLVYSYVPDDLAQAVTELIGGTYKSKDIINIRSKSLGGQETISYFQNEMTPSIKMYLQPFIRVTPQ